jgi:hypothetical protein
LVLVKRSWRCAVANERLREAMSAADVSVETLARSTDVDPKTVQRWIAGRIPHPRHRWAVVEQLHEAEGYLWPNAQQGSAAMDASAEVIGAYPHRSQVDAGRWWRLISAATSQIDLLGYTLYFLPQQHPQLVPTLVGKCDRGARIRLVIADPSSEHVRERDEEEQEPITLVARIKSSLRAFAPLLQCPGAELRFQDVPLYNSLFRCDDEMFVTPMLYATPGHSAPLLHLRRLRPDGLFSRFESHFGSVWDASTPVSREDVVVHIEHPLQPR